MIHNLAFPRKAARCSMVRTLTFAIAFVISLPTLVSAQAGALDPAFGVGGRVVDDLGTDEIAAGIAIQSDGKIVVAGSNLHDLLTVRYNSFGQRDSTFGSGSPVIGHFGVNQYAAAVAVQMVAGEEKILVGGTFEYGDFIIVRYNADGTLDSSFNGVGNTTTDFGGVETLTALALQPDGKIVAVGDGFRNPTPIDPV